MLRNNVVSAPVAMNISKYFFFRLAACYLKLKKQDIGLLNPDISNTWYPTFVWLLWWVKIAQAELPEKSLAKPIWVKNSNIFLRQYVLRNDIELISLWSMFTGYGVELADKKRYAWSPLFQVLIGKKTRK